MSNKLKVLFLSTVNGSRSQMAEAFLRKYGGDLYEAHSAGLDPGEIHPLTSQVMEEVGISLAGQAPKHVRTYLGKMSFGYLVTVCSNSEQNCPVAFMGMSHRLYWPLDDPAKFIGTPAETLAKFRQVRDQVDQLVQEFIANEEHAHHR
jgi:arsenate reductase